ncbi:MAG TPA: agmatinase, partial [Longimicrobiaceae bacterium]|nr:agmatinase [Longimicrobiaceae bacterium]
PDFLADGRLALLGIRYDAASSFLRGAADAPPRICEALRSDAGNLWTESGTDLGAEGLLLDAGDLTPQPGENPVAAIEQATARVLERGLPLLALGGDHSITYPVLRALRRRHPRLAVLHFDAHPDLYDEFEGDRYSHACPFARIMEEGLAERLVQVGIRAASEHQREQAERFGVEVVAMSDWRDDLVLAFDGPLYISFDTDALDPAFAPGVSHPEPGGFSTRQMVDALRRLDAPVVGADLVEYNPARDPLGLTAVVCAKILKEIAAKMLERQA